MKKYGLILFLAIIAVSFLGCAQELELVDANISLEFSTNTNTQKAYQEEWQELEQGLFFKEMPIYSKAGQEKTLQDVVTVFKFNPEHFTFNLKQNINEPKTVSEWQEKEQAKFVCNGSYFLENYQPSSYLKIQDKTWGTQLGAGSVGEVVFDKAELKIFLDANFENYNNILQSYPLLVTPDKKKLILNDSGEVAPRSVVAKDNDDNVLFIFSRSYYFSLYKLQNYLMDSDLNLKIALNLDGGTSSGYYLDGNITKLSESAMVPNVIMVFKK